MNNFVTQCRDFLFTVFPPPPCLVCRAPALCPFFAIEGYEDVFDDFFGIQCRLQHLLQAELAVGERAYLSCRFSCSHVALTRACSKLERQTLCPMSLTCSAARAVRWTPLLLAKLNVMNSFHQARRKDSECPLTSVASCQEDGVSHVLVLALYA